MLSAYVVTIYLFLLTLNKAQSFPLCIVFSIGIFTTLVKFQDLLGVYLITTLRPITSQMLLVWYFCTRCAGWQAGAARAPAIPSTRRAHSRGDFEIALVRNHLPFIWTCNELPNSPFLRVTHVVSSLNVLDSFWVTPF